MHDLHRFTQPFRVNGGPQDCLPSHGLLPGPLEGRHIQAAAAQGAVPLVKGLLPGPGTGREEQGLHRRQRINILNVADPGGEPVQRRLFKARNELLVSFQFRRAIDDFALRALMVNG